MRATPLRAVLLRAALGAALVGLVVGLDTSTARAGDDDTNESAWNKFMQTLGLKKPSDPDSDIKYTERSPLVVPPSRDLPPPAPAAAMPAPEWPKAPAKEVKHAKAKGEIVPATAVQTPNPPVVKKPWYNPAGWFNKEEYATFAGEPARHDLTDPPAGYRIPSPEQPYGISPENKTGKAATTASDLHMPPATQSGSQTGK
jgi:hypothetical protein